MDEALRAAGATRPVDVVVELGAGEGARTGVAHGGRVRRGRRRGRRRTPRCGWSASRVTRARCRTPTPERRPRVAAPADRAGRRLRRGGPVRRTLGRDRRQRGRQRLVRRGRRGLRRDPRAVPARAQAAALGRVRLARRRPLPPPHPVQPGPRGGRAAARVPALGPGRLPALARARRSSTPASGTPPTTWTCRRRRSSATRRDGTDAPGGRHHGHGSLRPARLADTDTPRPIWRSATGSAWASPTPARPSTSGS